jgi:DNA-directed RNA polymerase subunit RPC12/RpoP
MKHYTDALIEEIELDLKSSLLEDKPNLLAKLKNKLKKPEKQKDVPIWEDDPLAYDYEGREGSAKCSTCGKAFNLKELYKKIHDGSGKWVCPDCGSYLEIPSELEIFSSKFAQCNDCFNIYIIKNYANVDNPGNCECGGKLTRLLTAHNQKIPAIKDFAVAKCRHCANQIPMKDLVIDAKNDGGKLSCDNCPGTVEVPERYKAKFYKCKACGKYSLKAAVKNKDCPYCPGTLED